MYTVKDIIMLAERGLLSLPPEPRYRGLKIRQRHIPAETAVTATGMFKSFEDTETGEVLYRPKKTI